MERSNIITTLRYSENPPNKLTDKQTEFMKKLISLFAEYEMTATGRLNIREQYEREGKKDFVGKFFAYNFCVNHHNDVTNDYGCFFETTYYERDSEIELTATRACCENPNLITHCIDGENGIGYTKCDNCNTKRDWR